MTKAALVTGAAGGIGAGLVEALADAGWAVLGTDHPIIPPASGIRQRCHDWIAADLASLWQNADQLENFRTSVIKATAGCELMALVHNAALQRLGSFVQLSAGDWNAILSVNLMAPVVISRALLPDLQRNHGSIIHISSIHSQLTKPGFSAYATSKAALSGLTRAMAVELGAQIRVNAIEPAAIATPMLDAGFADSPDLKAELESCHPTASIGTPADVARAVLFLLDPANRFLNGCVLPLGGGIHSRLHDPA